MKTLYKYIFLLFGILPFTSCSEEKVEMFSSETGVNFRDDMGSATEINFYDYYLEDGIEPKGRDVKLYIQLEGPISNKPTNIRLATVPVEDYEEVEVILPGDSIIEAGEYTRGITVQCLRPSKFNQVFKTDVTFDYENSDVVPGTLEHQKKTLTVTDQTKWTDMMVDNEEGWNKYYESTLGKYGDMKIRFILATMGKAGYSYNNVIYLYQNTVYYPAYGFNSQRIQQLQTALDEYNATHDKPLCEQDGTPVSFK